ncbi:hypothetical protein Ami103574_00095 [Aminipila butyrica]|uniref:Uncharacterized protein n=1 Tax=Aminipila butyrica TaxID=433296 RepID=A0A858BSM9_9FIRM|nr:hypothetical protein [Aminipila butyrica]QIB67814.1 hypothetical protein Ami103574_00095 [Aminipila butyrica]
MVKIKISYETPEEKRIILAALDPVLEAKSIKGNQAEKPFSKAYITAKIKGISQKITGASIEI